MDRKAQLQEFAGFLAQHESAVRQDCRKQVDRVRSLSMPSAQIVNEFAADSTGHFEFAVADFANIAFPLRKEGKWHNIQDLQIAYKSFAAER